jgi:signal transduction histidine kinase
VLSRLPIRARLALAFTCVMAAVLAGTGLFLYDRLGSELDRTVNQGLRSSSDDVVALVRQADTGLMESGHLRITRPTEAFAQAIDARGRVLDATPGLPRRPLLSPAEMARARRGRLMVDRNAARLLATPVRAQDQRIVVVVGASLGPRSDALAGLRRLLLVGGPALLVLTGLAGYGLAARALRPLEAMRARERRFVADASHELLTPVAILHAELELAAGRPDEEAREALQSATQETARLSALARDLLVLAQSDENGLQMRSETIDVRGLVERVTGRFRPRAEEAGRGIATEAAPGLRVSGDPARLEQALSGLVDNALRHGAGDLTLSARLVAGRAELHVLDAGPGLPEGFAARAFERFSRATPEGEGAGLGLAIVAAIARAHGGSAHAADRSGGGADVWLELPGAAPGQASSGAAVSRASTRVTAR